MTNKAAKFDIICGLILCAQKRKIASLEQCTRPIFFICGMIQRTHNKPNVYYVHKEGERMRIQKARNPDKEYTLLQPQMHDEKMVHLDKSLIDDFINEKERQGCSKGTLLCYQRNLKRLYHYLPEHKLIGYGTIAAWRDDLLNAGYAQRTVNGWTSAANSLMEYCGRREFQVTDLVLPEEDIQPELSRNEYMRLLQAAKLQEKERSYLLVKVFALLGLNIHELQYITVRSVQDGVITISPKKRVRIPRPLQQELTGYAARKGIRDGPVFITRNGTLLRRSAVTAAVQGLAHDARVESAKCNPRCLRKLYQSTKAGIQQNISVLIDQAYDRLLENEQQTIGWEDKDSPLNNQYRPPPYGSSEKTGSLKRR